MARLATRLKGIVGYKDKLCIAGNFVGLNFRYQGLKAYFHGLIFWLYAVAEPEKVHGVPWNPPFSHIKPAEICRARGQDRHYAQSPRSVFCIIRNIEPPNLNNSRLVRI